MLKIKGAAGGLDWITYTDTHLTTSPSFPLAFLSSAAFPSLSFCNLLGPRPYKTVVNCTKTQAVISFLAGELLSNPCNESKDAYLCWS